MSYSFGKASLASRSKLHPLLVRIVDEAIKTTDFRILDAVRGRAAQEKAFREGNSKAHFGQSAHNYVPAVAMDLFPAPYDWNNTPSFENLSSVIMPIAKRLKIPLRWGGDWDMDGKRNRSGLIDLPHYELHPWRTYAERLTDE